MITVYQPVIINSANKERSSSNWFLEPKEAMIEAYFLIKQTDSIRAKEIDWDHQTPFTEGNTENSVVVLKGLLSSTGETYVVQLNRKTTKESELLKNKETFKHTLSDSFVSGMMRADKLLSTFQLNHHRMD